jgi:hypothetical protein
MGLTRALAKHLDEAGWGADLDRALVALAGHPDPDPAIAAMWGERYPIPLDDGWRQVAARLATPEVRRVAAMALLSRLARTVDLPGFQAVDRVLGDTVREHEGAWAWVMAAVGDVCSRASQDVEVLIRTWVDGWEARHGLSTETLLSVAVALRRLGRDEEARRASEQALTLDAAEASLIPHRFWCYADATWAGDVESAGRLRAQIDASLTTVWYQTALPFVDTVHDLQRAAGKKSSLTRARGRRRAAWRAAVEGRLSHDALMDGLERRAWRRLRMESPTLATRVAAGTSRIDLSGRVDLLVFAALVLVVLLVVWLLPTEP